jgi:hypothetical protein
MAMITLFKCESLPNVNEIVKLLNNKKVGDSLIKAKASRYNKNEVIIEYFYYEDVEDLVKRILSEDSDEVVSLLRMNGKTKVLRKTYCFINTLTRILEIYRGPDKKTNEIVSNLEKLLNVKLIQLSLTSQDLQKIYSKDGVELTQAMFKNINGLMYETLRGRFLENNSKFKEYLSKFPEALRVISFKPKIKFLNHKNKYQVTINGDKGTIKLSSNGLFKWRPRLEIRQITFIIAATLGLLAS